MFTRIKKGETSACNTVNTVKKRRSGLAADNSQRERQRPRSSLVATAMISKINVFIFPFFPLPPLRRQDWGLSASSAVGPTASVFLCLQDTMGVGPEDRRRRVRGLSGRRPDLTDCAARLCLCIRNWGMAVEDTAWYTCEITVAATMWNKIT